MKAKRLWTTLLACGLLLLAGCAAGKENDTPSSQTVSQQMSEGGTQAVNLVLTHVELPEEITAVLHEGTAEYYGTEFYKVAAGVDSGDRIEFTPRQYYYVSMDYTAIYAYDPQSDTVEEIWKE